MPGEHFLELNGLRHRLLVHEAEPGAPTLVVLHGFLDCAASFEPFIERLSARVPHRVVAPDLRGHGGTEWIGRGGYYHFADYVADVHALLATMEEPVALFGHSMGGSIAALVAGAFPEMLTRLVLVEGLGPIPSDTAPPDRMRQWIDEVNARRGRPSKPMSLEDAQQRLQRAHPRVAPEVLKRVAQASTRRVEGGYVWAYDPLHRTRSPMSTHAADFNTFLARIACPTLLVEGAESPFAEWATDDRRNLVRQLSQAKLPDAGHMIHLERPEALARLVGEFLMQA